MRLQVSLLARSDIDQIHDYIARDKPLAAARWVQDARRQFKFLARNPGVGEIRDDIRPGMRCFSHGSYAIYFRVESGVLKVVRVLHTSRDIRELL